MYDAQIGRFHVQDRFSNKYYGLTPYNYAGNDPIRLVDINGDSLDFKQMQQNNPEGLKDLKDDFQKITGLSLNFDENGKLSYETKKGFLGIRTAKIDKSKTTSRAARRFLKNAIKSKETVSVVNDPSNGNRVMTNDPKTIYFDHKEIGIIQSAMSPDLNPETFGAGMTVLHELRHTILGGMKRDPDNTTSFEPGEAEYLINKIRRQMGADWGQRKSYNLHKVDGNQYVPFDEKAKEDLQNGNVPTTKFLKF